MEAETGIDENKSPDTVQDSEEAKARHTNAGEKEVEECDPEGRRMQLLRKALDTTIAKCVSIGRFSLFAKLHPTVATKNTKALQVIHAQSQKRLKEAIAAEVETMCQEEQITVLMNSLDKIIAEGLTDETDPAWRPTGDPDKDLRAHFIPVKIKTRDRLKRILESVEDEKNRLVRVVLPARQNLMDMEKEIDEKSRKYNKVEEIDLKRIDNFMSTTREESSFQDILENVQ